MSGKIKLLRIYEITCARCDWVEEDKTYSNMTLQKAIRNFQQGGWQKIRGEGWVCPECVKGCK